MGRSQVVRQRVLVPRSQVRILAPQPSLRRHDRHPARSRRHGRRARHPHAVGDAEAPARAARPAHGRLGARGRPRELGADPRRRRRVARRRRDACRRRRRSPCRSSRSAPATPSRSARDALDGLRRRRARALRRHAAAHRRAARRARRRRTGASGAAATVLSFEPPDRAPYGRIVRGADGASARIVEATRRDARGAARSARSTPRSTSSAPATLWPALERLEPKNAQGELYLTDTIELLVAGGGTVAVPRRAPTGAQAEGVNTRAELAAAAAVLRDRINERAHARRRDDRRSRRRPGSTRASSSSPTSSIHPFTVLRGATRIGDGRRGRPARRRGRRARSARARPSGRSVTFAPARSSSDGSKAGTFVEIKNSRIGERTKVPHLSYVGDAEIGEDTNIGAGDDHRELPAPARASRRAGRRSGSNVRTGVHNAFVAPVEIGDDAWIAAGSVITEDVPAGRARGLPARGR